MKNLFNIKDKVVVITGGTGVLGKPSPFIWQKKVQRSSFWDARQK